MTRKHPIEANETLVAVVCSARIQRQYIRNSEFFGQTLTVAQMLDHLADDEIVTVLRVSTDTWAHEDITEYAARQYLYDRDEREGFGLSDEPTFPAYVRNSKAWALWKDDLEASAPLRITADHARKEAREAVHG
ncbi:hypothetical protein CYG48_04835 [Neorhizobium sp. SOG26]|uniref:hypothetical protein n=1 Tax=Neorhizobium sp. SOG26 TaxID=2060726 RepID=UPI000E56E6A6|nr:hypothetical protein [Neorhizobium sp. SOG26]AXV15082.1 hypothetical protein CYG48_04835 [Neorhizobium sp. SOG26]